MPTDSTGDLQIYQSKNDQYDDRRRLMTSIDGRVKLWAELLAYCRQEHLPLPDQEFSGQPTSTVLRTFGIDKSNLRLATSIDQITNQSFQPFIVPDGKMYPMVQDGNLILVRIPKYEPAILFGPEDVSKVAQALIAPAERKTIRGIYHHVYNLFSTGQTP